MKQYKYMISLIVIVITTSYIIIDFTKNMNGNLELNNYFWMPSSIMQSVAAIYALFIAVLVLSIQNNQKDISSVGDQLKPPFKMVSVIVATTIYFNGIVLFIFSHYKPTESAVSILYFGSLFSLLISLIAIVYFSFWIITAVTGLKTHDDIMCDLYGMDVKTCYKSLNKDEKQWNLKSEEEKARDIEVCFGLLEHGNPFIKKEVSEFLGNIQDTRAVVPLIKILDDDNAKVRQNAVKALGKIGDERAITSLINKLEDIDKDVRLSSAVALGKIGDERAITSLEKRKNDNNKYVRDASISSIFTIKQRMSK